LKVVLSIACYLLFTIYTVPTYKNVRAYVDERISTKKQNMIIGETAMQIIIVDTPESRQKGLSNREPLEEHEGMLFVFEENGQHGIWMKDMKFEIDIIWFNEYGEIIHYAENVSPDTYPQVFDAPQKSRYVLETLAGFVKQEGIKLGDKVDLY
jgi:uncharacterized membrane protein (UPF0127 family)